MQTNHRITAGVLAVAITCLTVFGALYVHGCFQEMTGGRVGSLYLLVRYQGTGIRPLFDRYDDVTWAEVAPRGDRIALGLGDPVLGRLYVAGLPNGRARLIANGMVLPPSWAPDGHRIAIIQRLTHRRSIRIIDTRSGKSRIVRPKGEAIPGQVVWSPRGDDLAIALEDGDAKSRRAPDLWLLRASDLKWRRLAQGVGSFDWSSDGRKIAYSTLGSESAFYPGGRGIQRPVETGIRMVSLDSGEDTLVASSGGGPRFVLDDGALLFSSESSAHGTVWLRTLGGPSRPKLIAKGDMGSVVPSPGGNEVVYLERPQRLVVVDLRRNRRRVTVVPWSPVGQLSWTPNGDEILFPWPGNGVWSVPVSK